MTKRRIAVFISGSGTNLEALFVAQERGELPITVVLVISDQAGAYGLQRALQRQVPAAFLPLPRASAARRVAVRQQWEQRLLAVLGAYQPDLIVSAGFLRVLSGAFLAQCGCPVINQHPALLPPDGGATVALRNGHTIPALRGLGVVEQALELGLPATGCSVHYVTAEVDAGPVLGTVEVPIYHDDTSEQLHERIKAQERQLLIEVLRKWCLERAHSI